MRRKLANYHVQHASLLKVENTSGFRNSKPQVETTKCPPTLTALRDRVAAGVGVTSSAVGGAAAPKEDPAAGVDHVPGSFASKAKWI